MARLENVVEPEDQTVELPAGADGFVEMEKSSKSPFS